VERLDATLERGWSRSNPVDLLGDADGARYTAGLEALLDDPGNDAILAVNVPTVLSAPRETAEATVAVLKARPRGAARKPVLALWLGNDDGATGLLGDAGVPTYASETEGVRGFMYLVRHREAQAALMETPPSLPDDFAFDRATAQALVDAALAEGREWLDPADTARLLRAYGIDLATPVQAADPDAAAVLAAPMLADGGTVAVKVLSPDIAHKSDVDGVRLHVGS